MAGNDTVTLRWPRPTTFVDYQTDQRFPGEGVYEVPAKWEGHYRRRGWVDPPEDHDGTGDEPAAAISRNMDGPSRADMEGASSPDGSDGENTDDTSDDGGDTSGN